MANTKIPVELSSTPGIVDNSNATAITIDSSENVGIGTTSPTGILTSYKSTNGDPVLGHFYNDNAGTATEATVYVTNSSILGNGLFLQTTGTAFTTVGGFVQDAAVLGSGAGTSGGLSIMTRANADMRFYTNGHTNERMRIESDGDVIVGGTSPYSVTKMTVDFVSETRFGFTLRDIGSSGTTRMINFVKSGSVVGSIDSSTTATSYSTSSDYRLKENVVTDWDATTRLKQLKPSRFNFIVDPDTTVDGFLAHEVEDIVPEAITGVKDEMQEEEYEVTPAVLDEDGNVVTEAVMGTREVPKYQGIDQSKLVPLLTKAIQELSDKVDNQQTIIEDLQARIETLENA